MLRFRQAAESSLLGGFKLECFSAQDFRCRHYSCFIAIASGFCLESLVEALVTTFGKTSRLDGRLCGCDAKRHSAILHWSLCGC